MGMTLVPHQTEVGMKEPPSVPFFSEHKQGLESRSLPSRASFPLQRILIGHTDLLQLSDQVGLL